MCACMKGKPAGFDGGALTSPRVSQGQLSTEHALDNTHLVLSNGFQVSIIVKYADMEFSN